MRFVLIALCACHPVSEDEFDALADHDDDGFLPPEVGGDDCDDGNAAVHPDAPEACDGLDNDCDGAIDDVEDVVRFWRDADADGVGDPTVWVDGCALPEGYVANDDDCDDAEPTIGLEVPLFVDVDEDGLGIGASEVRCPSAGWAAEDGDCDDGDPAIGPEQALFADGDGDGWGIGNPEIRCPGPGWGAGGNDCDDGAPAVNPGAVEVVCSDLDDDCDPIGTPDGPVLTATEGSFDTVQEALDYATGDLQICPGVAGGWVVTRPVVIEGAEPGVVVNAPASGPTVVIEGGGAVTLAGMVIAGRTGERSEQYLGGAVSNVDAATTVTLSSVVVLGGSALLGGGVGSDGPLVLDDVEISGGDANLGGGVWSGISLTVSSSLVEANNADAGGGIHAHGVTTLDDTVVRANVAGAPDTVIGGGGGMSIDGELTLANGTEVSGNTADRGGGVFLGSAGTCDAISAVVFDNTATTGAGLWLQNSMWTAGTISGNQASDGGGVYCIGCTLVEVVIDGNGAEDEGGGILSDSDEDISIISSIVQNNDAGVGGGLSASSEGATPTVTLTDSTFDANIALIGGGLALHNASAVGDGLTSISGGDGIYGGGVTLDDGALSEVIISNNTANYGGGVAVADFRLGEAVEENALVGVIIEGNTASMGGGLFVEDDQRVPIDAFSSVIANVAYEEGGGAYVERDGILVSSGADFGTGATDNTPEDVYTSSSGATFELTGADWTCTGDGCTSP